MNLSALTPRLAALVRLLSVLTAELTSSHEIR